MAPPATDSKDQQGPKDGKFKVKNDVHRGCTKIVFKISAYM